jgi:hypothetical protein
MFWYVYANIQKINLVNDVINTETRNAQGINHHCHIYHQQIQKNSLKCSIVKNVLPAFKRLLQVAIK